MKLTALIVLLITFTTASHATHCSVKGIGVIAEQYPLADYVIESHSFQVAKWQDCYTKAALLAEANASQDEDYIYDEVHYEWEFNDGWVDDSDGIVNYTTRTLHKTPAKGDRR